MKNVYIGNLPHKTTDVDLRDLFAVYGTVENVNIITDRETGRARGFAFVEMPNPEEAEKAIAALNGSELGGRTLNVNEAKPKAAGPRGSGGQRYGGGRGRDDYRGHARQPREPRW
jgi:cold-inducible RNA-binding protein